MQRSSDSFGGCGPHALTLCFFYSLSPVCLNSGAALPSIEGEVGGPSFPPRGRNRPLGCKPCEQAKKRREAEAAKRAAKNDTKPETPPVRQNTGRTTQTPPK